MNKIFDNGYAILGTKFNIEKYCEKQKKYYLEINDNYVVETFEEMLEDIKDYKNTDIVCINYENGMGFSVDKWDENDVIWKELI